MRPRIHGLSAYRNALLLLSGLVTLAGASSIHVSPEGGRDGTGSRESPLSLASALEILGPGDTCWVHGGVYREILRPARSGAPGRPQVFLGVAGEHPILSGADPVGPWVPHATGEWAAATAGSVEQLFLDGRPLVEARYPNAGRDLFRPSTFPLNVTRQEAFSEALGQEEDHWKGATLWSLVNLRWLSQTARVTGSAPGTLLLAGNSLRDNEGEAVGFLSGIRAALDTADEWVREGDSLLWIPASEDEAMAGAVEARVRRWVIDLSDRSDVVVGGLETFAGAANLDGSRRCVLQDLSMRHLSHFVGIPNGATSSSWVRHPSTNIDYPGIGIGVFGDSNVVRRCDLRWSAGDGILVFGNDNLVEHNSVRDVDYSGTDCAGLVMMGDRNRFTRNTVDSCGRGCVYLAPGTRSSRVDHNLVSNPGIVAWDVGAIYLWGVDGEDTRIDHNWVHSVHSEGGLANGIYVDNFCSKIVVDHNVVWDCQKHGMTYSRPAVDILWAHNTVFQARNVLSSYLHFDALEDTSRDNRLWNNLMTARYGRSADFDALDQSSNVTTSRLPLRDTASWDFRLLDGAVGIDSGVRIPGINDDFVGRAPDAGAYEWGGIWWKAGAGSFDGDTATGVSRRLAESASWALSGRMVAARVPVHLEVIDLRGRRLLSLDLAAGQRQGLPDFAGIAYLHGAGERRAIPLR